MNKGSKNMLRITKNFLIFFLILFNFITDVFANLSNNNSSGFYVGVDPSKTNNKVGNIDNSVTTESKLADDRYYGYKFSGGGFFVSPELFMNSNNNLSVQSSGNSSNTQTQRGALGATYDVKANFGYEFSEYVSGFVTYDLGAFSYRPGQKNVTVGSGTATSSAVGIGSQINLSNSFGLKLIYTQQQFENSAVGGGQIRSNVFKVGTVYNF